MLNYLLSKRLEQRNLKKQNVSFRLGNFLRDLGRRSARRPKVHFLMLYTAPSNFGRLARRLKGSQEIPQALAAAPM